MWRCLYTHICTHMRAHTPTQHSIINLLYIKWVQQNALHKWHTLVSVAFYSFSFLGYFAQYWLASGTTCDILAQKWSSLERPLQFIDRIVGLSHWKILILAYSGRAFLLTLQTLCSAKVWSLFLSKSLTSLWLLWRRFLLSLCDALSEIYWIVE